MSEKYRGSCLCGDVAFEVGEFSEPATHCHCSMCRKFHGAAFATFVEVEQSAFHLLRGEEKLGHFEAENGTVRSFCRRCGSSLFFKGTSASEDVVEVALAAFDGPVPVTPDVHIFVGSGVEWAQQTQGLPRHVEGRESPVVPEKS